MLMPKLRLTVSSKFIWVNQQEEAALRVKSAPHIGLVGVATGNESGCIVITVLENKKKVRDHKRNLNIN